ncbi:unnamed protein product [Dracunculus medinensis]|uniref:Uncharacterized protein n=1 Tax=Dracunculus medinensis TaxID=318479 RepID=A0A0N4U154_DRAME|nr:unnamed protein product [Dracunculus medinensis]
MNNENHQLSRVEELRRLLEDSLKIDEKIFHNNSKFTVSSEVIQKMLRPLKILYRNDRRAIIQISGPSSSRKKDNNSEMAESSSTVVLKHNRSISPAPLEVIVGVTVSNCNSINTATIEQKLSVNDSSTSSPVGSVDSGVSLSSPSISPISSPINTQNNLFCLNTANSEDLPHCLRQRSTSDSVSFGLKSILKKTPVVYRGRFISRSVSECEHSEALNSITGGLSSEMLQEEGETTESTEYINRKKRVSFSERLVKEHCFRPNSSILGQKKKNQRKIRNKLKKKANEEVLNCERKSNDKNNVLDAE